MLGSYRLRGNGGWTTIILGCLLWLAFPAAAGAQDTVLAIGDKIKLIVLETPDGGTAESGEGMFVERAELTGEYMVQEGGMIDVPLLGQAQAAEHPITYVKQFLHDKYKELFGREPRVSVTLIGREPVYIVGPVARPGSYDYSPNLSVLHLIARAGGPNTPASNNWEMLETIRERYKLQVSLARQQKLLALIAVLEVEGSDQEPVIPARLRILAGEGAEAFLAEARALRATIAESRKLRLESLDASISTVTELLKNKNERVRFMAANVESRDERMQALKGLKERGGGNGFNLNQAKSDWSEANDRLQEALEAASQVEERSAQLQMERKKLLLEAKMEIERELMEARDKLMEEERTAAASAQIAQITPEVSKLSDISSTEFYYSIQRTIDGMVTTFEASDVTLLRPGDLIIVKKNQGDNGLGRSIVPTPGLSGVN